MLKAVGRALQDRSYLLLHAGFFTCGFHIAFLVTHLPGEGQSVRFAAIGRQLVAGHHRPDQYLRQPVRRFLRCEVPQQIHPGHDVWFAGVLVAWYLLMPRTEWTFYRIRRRSRFTWLATVPPTAAIVGKLFGIRYLATLFG